MTTCREGDCAVGSWGYGIKRPVMNQADYDENFAILRATGCYNVYTGMADLPGCVPIGSVPIVSNVVGALRADGTTFDVQWYQDIAGNVKILDNGVVKSQSSYPAGQNWNTIIGLVVGSHSICVEGG